MGLAKAEWIEVQEREWSAPDTHVCVDFVEDSHLKDLVRKMACAYTCDYCGHHATQAIAAEAGVVMKAVYDAVYTYYGEPADAGVPYDGGVIVSMINIVEVLGCLGFDGHPDFVSAVTNAETTDFVLTADGHWAGSHPHEVLSRLGAHSAIRSSTKRADTVKVCEVEEKRSLALRRAFYVMNLSFSQMLP
jgi:HEPN/RES N-terminal domain 1